MLERDQLFLPVTKQPPPPPRDFPPPPNQSGSILEPQSILVGSRAFGSSASSTCTLEYNPPAFYSIYLSIHPSSPDFVYLRQRDALFYIQSLLQSVVNSFVLGFCCHATDTRPKGVNLVLLESCHASPAGRKKGKATQRANFLKFRSIDASSLSRPPPYSPLLFSHFSSLRCSHHPESLNFSI